jgi:hypothetical protein
MASAGYTHRLISVIEVRMKVTFTFILGWKYSQKTALWFHSKSWGRGWCDGRYYYLSRFAKIGNFHVRTSVLPPQCLFSLFAPSSGGSRESEVFGVIAFR